MCNTPVTFGGGITTVNGGRSSGVELKYRFDFQCDVHFSSIDFGSKFFDSSISYFWISCCPIIIKLLCSRLFHPDHRPLRRSIQRSPHYSTTASQFTQSEAKGRTLVLQ